MATLDEISKERQRVSEALARVDAQREKLVGQLGELEATERVLARYSKGPRARKMASARTPIAATKVAAPSAIRRAPAHYGRETSWRQAQLTEPQRSGPCPGKR